MSYIAVTLNHFRALQRWATAQDAQAWLDMRDFHVEVRKGVHLCRLHPQFMSSINGTLYYTAQLTSNVQGFVGWLPYRPLRWPLSTDKLNFKRFAEASNLRTPARWQDPARIDKDHVIKRSVGSFGTEVYGPFRAGEAGTASRVPAGGAGTLYAEQFVPGRNVKLWYWGATPFHAHVHPYAAIMGDGQSPVADLLSRKLERLGRSKPNNSEWSVVMASLAYQGLRMTDIPLRGAEVWVDFRYGRSFDPDPAQSEPDNMLGSLPAKAHAQADEMGRKLSAELLKTHPLPLLFAMDAVLDGNGDLWWLEANSNPVLPPTGYPLMLASVFESSFEQPAESSNPAVPAH